LCNKKNHAKYDLWITQCERKKTFQVHNLKVKNNFWILWKEKITSKCAIQK